MKLYKYFLIALAIIALDQTSKVLVSHFMYLHEEVNVVSDWFKLHYLLNPGMAFGFQWENEFGKLALTIFRIGAMFGIAYYLIRSAKKNSHAGFLVCLALILGGAIGNVIDSTFYGVFLDNAPMMSPYKWFHGQVIDMLYFPLVGFALPEWVPFRGGTYFSFFDPVFNIADSSIFYWRCLHIDFPEEVFPSSEEQQHENELPINHVQQENPSAITVTEVTETKTETENNG